MKRIIPFFILSLIMMSCSETEDPNIPKGKVVEIPEEFKKNPTTVEWERSDYDFGTIGKDSIVFYVYKFKNTGDNPLIVADCKVTCGCTVPECKQPPIPPGGSGEIKVSFNSHNKANQVNKTVKVYMNTKKEIEEVKFTVFVDNEN